MAPELAFQLTLICVLETVLQVTPVGVGGGEAGGAEGDGPGLLSGGGLPGSIGLGNGEGLAGSGLPVGGGVPGVQQVCQVVLLHRLQV